MPKRRALLLAGVTAVLAAVFMARRKPMSEQVPPAPPPSPTPAPSPTPTPRPTKPT